MRLGPGTKICLAWCILTTSSSLWCPLEYSHETHQFTLRLLFPKITAPYLLIPSQEHTLGLFQTIFKMHLGKDRVPSTIISGLARETSARSQRMSTEVLSGKNVLKPSLTMQLPLALSHLFLSFYLFIYFTKNNQSGPCLPPASLLL